MPYLSIFQLVMAEIEINPPYKQIFPTNNLSSLSISINFHLFFSVFDCSRRVLARQFFLCAGQPVWGLWPQKSLQSALSVGDMLSHMTLRLRSSINRCCGSITQVEMRWNQTGIIQYGRVGVGEGSRCVINVLNRQRTFHVPCLLQRPRLVQTPLPSSLYSQLLGLCVYLRVQQFEPDPCGLMCQYEAPAASYPSRDSRFYVGSTAC